MNFRFIALVGILAFLVSFITFAQPGSAQAALTLNNFVGFETGGMDEASASSGSPTVQGTTVRSGDFALSEDGNSDIYSIAIIKGGTTDSDNDFILGFGFQQADAASQIIEALDDLGGGLWRLEQIVGQDARLFDANDIEVVTATDAFSGTFQFLEIRWQHSASGAFDLHIDGISIISETAVDLTDGDAISADSALYRLRGDSDEAAFFDDIYMYSGATGTGDFLGDAEVFRYQANTNSATSDRACNSSTTSLDQGVWQDLGETPLSSEATEPAYTASNVGGAIDTEDTQSGNHYRHGPHGDANIDGTIQGAKWLHVLRRGTGPGTTHSKCYGNSGDGTSFATVSLDTGFLNFFTISEVGTVVPTSSEHISHGFHTGGSQNINSQEIWGFLLHVPPAGTTRRIFPIQ